MQVEVPHDFETFAREQIEGGHVGSVEEAASAAFRDYMEEIKHLRALVDPAIADLDSGKAIDGETFMSELLAETRALAGPVARGT